VKEKNERYLSTSWVAVRPKTVPTGEWQNPHKKCSFDYGVSDSNQFAGKH